MKKDKEVGNNKKRKYEFKNEKNKKQIIKIVLSALVVILALVLVTSYLKQVVYIDSNNTDIENVSFNASTNISTKSIKLNYKYIVTYEGRIKYLKATITPNNSTDSIKWTSSNNKVATVDATGTVQTLKPGIAVIKVKSGWRSANATILVLSNGNSSSSNKLSLFSSNKVSVNYTTNMKSTTVNYNDVVKFNVSFMNSSSSNYYYKWVIYQTNDVVYKDSGCSIISANNTTKRDVKITMNRTDKHGEFVVYSDSSCSNQVSVTKTSTYNLDNQFSYFYNGIGSINNAGTAKVYTENGVSSLLKNQVIANFTNYYKKTPGLYFVSNIYVLTKDSYNKKYDYNYSGNSSTAGMTKSGGINNTSTITIYAPSGAEASKYASYNRKVVNHELGHALNNYYEKKTLKAIKNQDDIVSLYNKYKSNNNNYFRTYAYTNTSEFWAESFAMYYDNVYYKISSGLPSDVKNVVKKYINAI